ncbi:MAG: shikimate dehydrogenase [Chlamydiales bacterium]|nr:shikimate dehydrogenase [Chlamydiales bacterium]
MLICVAIPGPDLGAIRDQMAKAESQGTMIEWRTDLFNNVGIEDLVSLRHQCSLPLVLTLKGNSTNLMFAGVESSLHGILRHLHLLKPEVVDVEMGTRREDIELIKKTLPDTRVMLSHHDTNQMPSNLRDLLHSMQQFPADYYKIAVTPKSAVEALQMVHFTREVNSVGGQLCGIGMGSEGQITRILAPISGAPITYACVDESVATAPGQLPVQALNGIYGVDRLNYDSMMLGLIGNPVDASKGYLIHNAVFKRLSIPAVYVRMCVDANHLPELFQEARRLKWKGFSVTMPLKEAVIPFLDAIDPSAQAIGAVNTIVLEEDRGYVGYNFDGIGALDAIEARKNVYGQQFIVLGAGGAAKAIAYEAKQRGAEVTILNRSYGRAEMLAKQLGVHAKPLERLSDILRSAPGILAQTTSVGMTPNVNDTLVEAKDLVAGTLVFDAVAYPPETRLLREAKESGCETVSGVMMWLGQAERQILQWFDGSASTQEVHVAVLDASEGR